MAPLAFGARMTADNGQRTSAPVSLVCGTWECSPNARPDDDMLSPLFAAHGVVTSKYHNAQGCMPYPLAGVIRYLRLSFTAMVLR